MNCGEGCTKCTATSATEKSCSEKAAGYFIKAGVATKCFTNCAVCDDENVGKCTKPADGYYFDFGLGRCAIANCQLCPNDRTKCDTCLNSFFKTTTTPVACNACIKNCVSCKDDKTCDTC